MNENVGEVVQVIGPVVDMRFKDRLPKLYNAIIIPFGNENITCEVEQDIGDDKVRCIALSQTSGLTRGMKAIDTGKAIQVPVGKDILGRMFNLLGQPGEQAFAVQLLFLLRQGDGVHRFLRDLLLQVVEQPFLDFGLVADNPQ